MAKAPLKEPQERVPTFAFLFFRNPDDPHEWTSEYLRDGVSVHKSGPNSFIMNAAVMERKMRMSIHEGQ